MELKKAILNFADIPYERKLEERALYPISDLNYLTGGMELGEMSVIAGASGGGKTTFASQCVGEIIKTDKVFCVFGESTIKKQQVNMYRQFAGFGKEKFEYLQYEKNGKKTNIGQWFVTSQEEQVIKNKTNKKLFLYDIKYGMTAKKILEAVQFAYEYGGINHHLIDNIMQIETLTENELKETKDNMELFRQFVINNKVHISLLAHYRKSQENNTIRRALEEIAGTSQIGNKVATALNIIRLDNIDKTTKQYKSFKGLILNTMNIDLDECDAIIEVLKTRHNRLGFIPLKYNNTMNSYYQLKEWEKSNNSTKGNDEKAVLHSNQTTQKATRLEDLVPIEDDGELPF